MSRFHLEIKLGVDTGDHHREGEDKETLAFLETRLVHIAEAVVKDLHVIHRHYAVNAMLTHEGRFPKYKKLYSAGRGMTFG